MEVAMPLSLTRAFYHANQNNYCLLGEKPSYCASATEGFGKGAVTCGRCSPTSRNRRDCGSGRRSDECCKGSADWGSGF